MSCEPECPEQASVCTPHGAGIIVTDKLDIPALPDGSRCGPLTYLNVAQTVVQSCEEGSPTAEISVTIPYGTIISEISQEDADDKALAKACNDALQLRVCTPCEDPPIIPVPEPEPTVYFNVEQTVSLQCDSMSPFVTVTVLAGTYTSEIDQDYADGLAADAALTEVIGNMDCVWGNTEQEATASCPDGTSGPDVTKTTPANSYYSHDSQEEADYQAYLAALAEAEADLVCS